MENGDIVIRLEEDKADDMLALVQLCLTDLAIIQSFYDMSESVQNSITAIVEEASMDCVNPLEVMRNTARER